MPVIVNAPRQGEFFIGSSESFFCFSRYVSMGDAPDLDIAHIAKQAGELLIGLGQLGRLL